MTRVGQVLIDRVGNVVHARLDRPEQRNCIDFGIIEGLEHAVAMAQADASLLVIRGSGGNFCAGADLALVRGLIGDRQELEAYVTRLSDVLDAIEAGPFVSLAAVEGYAVAGGCEMLLACDVVLASTEARIADRHLEHALLPGAGGSVRLVRALPRAYARWLLLSGEMISGDQAQAWGLAAMAVSPDRFESQLDHVVDRLASRDPAATAAVREMARCAEVEPVAVAMERERVLFLDHITTSPTVRASLDGFGRRS
ncbi:MAG: enoyl-CoA hydratase/isomerase family protein [Nocardioides sp.]